MAACTGGSETGTSASAGATATAPSTQRGDDLLDRLRGGGLTVVIRHAATDQSPPDAPTVDLDDCSTRRNLSDEGRADARAIGNAISRRDIPVGETWASPYCRSRDTARLSFDRFEVVHGLERLYPERDEQADRRLNQRIQDRAPHADEPNLIIVSHGSTRAYWPPRSRSTREKRPSPGAAASAASGRWPVAGCEWGVASATPRGSRGDAAETTTAAACPRLPSVPLLQTYPNERVGL
ncbi:histidine phosphatase family protein [Streptomyces sp. TRM70350]|uniref:histidine phosphatase family protein n=1 Tax=Streptomyces sp. TRM70350 TaxID=2856165 RepID=UPI001C48A8CA|nr:histidine phosphatase family protein [Streptomyces sp. TRM70350]